MEYIIRDTLLLYVRKNIGKKSIARMACEQQLSLRQMRQSFARFLQQGLLEAVAMGLPSVDEEIVRLYGKMPNDRLAAKLGITSHSLRQRAYALRRSGLLVWSSRQVGQEVLENLKAGKTNASEIANQVGKTEQYVQIKVREFRQKGLFVGSLARRPRSPKKNSKAAKILQLILQGITDNKTLAKKTMSTPTAVSVVKAKLRKEGIVIPDRRKKSATCLKKEAN